MVGGGIQKDMLDTRHIHRSEAVLTAKDLLAEACQRKWGHPKWFPISFNLVTQLPEVCHAAFGGCYTHAYNMG